MGMKPWFRKKKPIIIVRVKREKMDTIIPMGKREKVNTIIPMERREKVNTIIPKGNRKGKEKHIAIFMPAWSECEGPYILPTIVHTNPDTVSAKASQKKAAINRAAFRPETTTCLYASGHCSWS